MFGFFRKKEKGIAVRDRVWITEPAKFRGILSAWKQSPDTVIICWTEDTRSRLQRFFEDNNAAEALICVSRELSSHLRRGKPYLFAEHHPSREKEEQLYRNESMDNVVVYSSLDEPLYVRFGSDRIVAMMRKLKMNEEEAIEHRMITKSIRRAQEKFTS